MFKFLSNIFNPPKPSPFMLKVQLKDETERHLIKAEADLEHARHSRNLYAERLARVTSETRSSSTAEKAKNGDYGYVPHETDGEAVTVKRAFEAAEQYAVTRMPNAPAGQPVARVNDTQLHYREALTPEDGAPLTPEDGAPCPFGLPVTRQGNSVRDGGGTLIAHTYDAEIAAFIVYAINKAHP